MIKGKKGFTLVELMIVILIVAILTALSVPLMRGWRIRAVLTEATMALGAVRTQMRIYYAQYGEYQDGDFNYCTDINGITDRQGAYGTGDLDGTFFSQECYIYKKYDADTFSACCYAYGYGANNVAPRASYAQGLLGKTGCWLKIHQDGSFTSSIPGLGY